MRQSTLSKSFDRAYGTLPTTVSPFKINLRRASVRRPAPKPTELILPEGCNVHRPCPVAAFLGQRCGVVPRLGGGLDSGRLPRARQHDPPYQHVEGGEDDPADPSLGAARRRPTVARPTRG